jgi:hypothetical protein
VPFLDEALAWGAGVERILLNHGAFATIDACFDLLAPSGILLINDYGPVRRDEVAAHPALQRFGGSAAHGINFPLLAHHAERQRRRDAQP